jgi:Transglutaminase-like enzymes, putative cysteine proteases
MPSYKIKHITRYSYTSTVIDCTNQIMLYPIVDALLEIRSHEIKISHDPLVESFVDYFGNHVGVFSIIKPHTGLLIESVADVITKPVLLPTDDMIASAQWEILKNLKFHTAYIDFLQPEVFNSHEEVKNILTEFINAEKTPLQNAITLSDYVYNNFTYQKGITNCRNKNRRCVEAKSRSMPGFCSHITYIFAYVSDSFTLC